MRRPVPFTGYAVARGSRGILFGIAALGLVVTTACENVNSDDVDTEGVYADLYVTADGDGSSLVYAALKVGGANSNTFLDLTDGDTLIAYQDTDSNVMIRHTLAGKVWYESSFPVDAEDTPFKVSFLRVHTGQGSEECVGASAPDSDVTMAAPFNMTAPTAGTTFSRASDDVVVSWDNTGSDQMFWAMGGSCIEPRLEEITGDPGTFTILAAEFQPLQNQEAETCDVTISIERRRAGTIDTAYGEGGHIYARQLRSVTISSAP